MKIKYNHNYFLLAIGLSLFSIVLIQCKPDIPTASDDKWVYDPTPYKIPRLTGLPALPNDPADNPTTIKGVELGRKLFYDPLLSGDGTLACAGCHNSNYAFSDSVKFSVGIDGLDGKRNAMPIYNLTYSQLNPEFIGFFWDGRAATLEDQALLPIQDPLEMHEILPNVVAKLNADTLYQRAFFEAFNSMEITADLMAKAIAQFVRTIVSGNTKFDRAFNAEPGVFLTEQELLGWELFNDNFGGDCFHCHGINGGLFTDFIFRNNGLDDAVFYTDFPDAGLGSITGDTADYGKFKTPSLRNIALTAPYMHDGRFATLEEVLDHYSTGVKDSPFTDQFMQFSSAGGVNLTEEEKAAIIAFLHTLTDTSLDKNPAYQDPFIK